MKRDYNMGDFRKFLISHIPESPAKVVMLEKYLCFLQQTRKVKYIMDNAGWYLKRIRDEIIQQVQH